MDLTEVLNWMKTKYGAPDTWVELVINDTGAGRIQKRHLTQGRDGITYYSDAEVLLIFKSLQELKPHVLGLAPFA